MAKTRLMKEPAILFLRASQSWMVPRKLELGKGDLPISNLRFASAARGLSKDNRIFDLLDTLRGLAAIVVLWSHFGPWTGPYKIPLAGVAVDLFFVISGFVIAHSYEARLSAGWSFSRFFAVRVIRLYPMYAFGVAISVAAPLFFSVGRDAKAAAVQALMLPYPVTTALYPLNGPGWSLMFELIINIIYALTFKMWTIRNLVLVMSGSAAALLFFALSGVSLDGGWNWAEFHVGLARVTFGFSAGVLIFRFFQMGQRFPRVSPAVVVALGILPIVLAPSVPEWHWRLPIVVLCVPACVALAVSSSTKQPSKTSKYLGRISYPLYALHYPCIFMATLALPSFSNTHPPYLHSTWG